jgi:hypothetical protein
MSEYKAPKLSLAPQSETEDKLAKASSMIGNLINTKIQLENQEYQNKLRQMQKEELEQEQERTNFAYSELSSIWGDEKLESFRAMGMQPELANKYLQNRALNDFISSHKDGFTVSDITSNSQYLSGDAVKTLMNAAKDSPDKTRVSGEVEINNWLYDANPSTYAEFTQKAADLDLNPMDYLQLWNEYEQNKKGKDGGESGDTDASVPQTTSAEADATSLRDYFSIYGFDLTKVPLNDYSTAHIQESLQAINFAKNKYHTANNAVPQQINGMVMSYATNTERVLLRDGDTRYEVGDNDKVYVTKMVDGKWERVKHKNQSKEERINAALAQKSGHDKLYDLYVARGNLRTTIKNQYNRLANNLNSTEGVRKLYGE